MKSYRHWRVYQLTPKNSWKKIKSGFSSIQIFELYQHFFNQKTQIHRKGFKNMSRMYVFLWAITTFVLMGYLSGVSLTSLVYFGALILSFLAGFFMRENGIVQTLAIAFYLLVLKFWILCPYVVLSLLFVITERYHLPPGFNTANIILISVSMLYTASFFVIGPKMWRAIKN